MTGKGAKTMTEGRAKAILEAVKNHDIWAVRELVQCDVKAVCFIIQELIKKQSMIEQAIKHLTE